MCSYRSERRTCDCIKYHKRCWCIHVTNVLRRATNQMCTKSNVADEIAAEIEFLSLVENELLTGQIVSISVLQDTYASILSANNVKSPPCSRKKLKPKRLCEPERVSIKCTRDSAIQFVEENDTDVNRGMKALYSVVLVLREAINKSKAWGFSGSLTDLNEGHLSRELYSFF